MEELLRKARWSDLFFNGDWVPNDPYDLQSLSKSAEEFLRLHPDCPYTSEWLIADFQKRL